MNHLLRGNLSFVLHWPCFLKTYKELAYGEEYIWIPLIPIIKCYDNFSFERFISRLKVYLELRRGEVKVELDLHESKSRDRHRKGLDREKHRRCVCSSRGCRAGLQDFLGMRLHSLYMDKYVYLKLGPY